MADSNDMFDLDVPELSHLVVSDADELIGEQMSFSLHEESELDDLPQSLLSYFETSKSRAAVCEQLILEEPEDFTSSYDTGDITNLAINFDENMMNLNEQVICAPENLENNKSADTRLLPAPTEAETLCTDNVSVCPNNEVEGGTDTYMESEEHLSIEAKTLDISLNEEERKKNSAYEAKREKRRCEEMKMEEQKRQIESDFQEELRKIMEAEKLHQQELELKEKRAQEKLEQEFRLQQELISSLQRRVEEERRMMEEEQRRIKEEDKRKREEEKVKMEAERKRREEEARKREQEERRIEEMKLQKKEDERRRIEMEERRREEERIKTELEKKKLEEEEKVKVEAERKRREEETRREEEEEERRIEEMKRKRKEEERRRIEMEERRREEERIKLDLEKKKLEEEEERKGEEENAQVEAERKRMEEEARRKEEEKIDEMKRKKEEEERRRMERRQKRREEEQVKMDLERKKLGEEEEMKSKEEVERMKKKEERKRIEEARMEMEKIEREKRKMEEGMSQRREDERWKKEEERKKQEELKMRTEEEFKERKKHEEMRGKKEEEEPDDRETMAQERIREVKKEYGHVDEEIKFEKREKIFEGDENIMEEEEEEQPWQREMERNKMEEMKNVKQILRHQEGKTRELNEERRASGKDEKKKLADESKTEVEERKKRRHQEEMRKEMDEENNRKSEEEMRPKDWNDVDNRKMEHKTKAKDLEKTQEDKGRKEVRKNVEAEKDVGENKQEANEKLEEEFSFKLKEKSRKIMEQDHEKREKREHNSPINQSEKNDTDKTEKSIQLKNSTSTTSSSADFSHSESKSSPARNEAAPQQHDLDKNISQTSRDKTVDCENQASRPSTVSVSLPVSLPEHTELKRLSWMKDCISWSRLSLQNRRKQKGPARDRRGLRRTTEASNLPPLCPDSLLQSTGRKSLQEVATVTLQDLPGCSFSTLAQCTQLRSLSLRRCGLTSLEGISQLPQLCYIDAQENDISFVDCENMSSLRVLKLGHNKLTSIHGLTGAENLDVVDLSHNSITRIAGLETLKRLQRLSVDHNQLISTKGLRDIYTLLHLSCSHNHLASVEGLENNALLSTLDLRANSLTEPPSLNNQVLLRELHLDDNSISSLQDFTACWLPLLQHLSVAQNRITQLPSMSDFVSLEILDLRFNCVSEVQNVYQSLQGCHFLQGVHLTGNPLQQEVGWRSTLHEALPSLRAIDDQQTGASLSPPAAQQVSLASGSFLSFCQAQLQQINDLQQQHSRELSKSTSSLDAVQTSCRHFSEALQLATDHRFAHEYGDTSSAEEHEAAGQIMPVETLDSDSANVDRLTECSEVESTGRKRPLISNRDNIRKSYWTFDEKSAAESQHDTFTTETTGPTANKANSGSVHSSVTKRKSFFSSLETAPMSEHQDLDLQISAAVMIQQLWRKYRQKCGNISSPSTAEEGGGRGGDGREPGPGPSYINGSVVGQDYAATVIQAFWRGFSLRRRLASALAAVTSSDTGEDDTFEEVDVDEFIFDEAALEKHWTLPFSEDSPPRHYRVLAEPLKPLRPFSEPSPYTLPPPVARRSKQAWVAPEQVASYGQRDSPESLNRNKSPAPASVVSGLSERSEKILGEWGFTNHHTALLMLKRAQNMKSKKHQQRKRMDPSIRLALFRNSSFQPGPMEVRSRKERHNRNHTKVHRAELGLQQAETTEREKQERARQWLHNQAAHSDRDSESERFLPEISSDILNGGRVQLVADSGYTEHQHHASGLWANSSVAAQPRRENNYPRRNSLGHAREDVPSPKQSTSAPSKKERISFRDNPVQLSGGWGGGKKRGKVYK